SNATTELRRFSRVIPLPVVLLVASGLWLVFVQVDRVEALWTTRYGQVLSCKLVAVVALLGLAAANRYRLVLRYQAGEGGAARLPPRSRPRSRPCRGPRSGASPRRRARWPRRRRSRSISMATRRWPRSPSRAPAPRPPTPIS